MRLYGFLPFAFLFSTASMRFLAPVFTALALIELTLVSTVKPVGRTHKSYYSLMDPPRYTIIGQFIRYTGKA